MVFALHLAVRGGASDENTRVYSGQDYAKSGKGVSSIK